MLAAQVSIAASLCGILRAFFGDFLSPVERAENLRSALHNRFCVLGRLGSSPEETSVISPQLVASDRFAGRQVVGHIQMVPKRRKRLVGPILQPRIVCAFGITLEQRHRVPVTALLVTVITRAEH
jgi:hypothetical protein